MDDPLTEDERVGRQLQAAEASSPTRTEMSETTQQHESEQASAETQQKPCNHCGSTNGKLRRCTGCQVAWYCGKNCQTADWGRHKINCKKRDVPTDPRGDTGISEASTPVTQELPSETTEHERERAQDARQTELSDWKYIVEGWYPDFDSQTYCVPPCIMNRIPYEKCTVNGRLAFVTKPFDKKDAADFQKILQRQKAREKSSKTRNQQSSGQASKQPAGKPKRQPQKKQTKSFKKETSEEAPAAASGGPSLEPAEDQAVVQHHEQPLQHLPEKPSRTLQGAEQFHQTTKSLPLSDSTPQDPAQATETTKSSSEQPPPEEASERSAGQTRQRAGYSATQPKQEVPEKNLPQAFLREPHTEIDRQQLSCESREGQKSPQRTDEQPSTDKAERLLPEQASVLPHESSEQVQETSSSGASRLNPIQHPEEFRLPKPLQTLQKESTESTAEESGESDASKTIPCMMWRRELDAKPTPTNVRESDVRDDLAQQHILYCLQKLGEVQRDVDERVMFILSTLDYNDYLNKPCYAEAAKTLPRPVDVPDHQKGDFDLLVIHRRHGVLIGEIKTVGSEDPADRTVATKIRDAYKQLNKSEVVVRHILSDLKLDVRVRKTLILPNITKDRLKRVLENNFDLKKAVSACVGVDETDPAKALDKTLGMCLCGDDMSDPATPWLVDKDVLPKLTDWWQNRMATTQAPPLQKGLYLDVISRFVGPATTVSVHFVFPPRVEVRTLWEAVSEIGERLARLVLTPQQLELLTRVPEMVCLTGPPGTGKTIMLVLVGLYWLRGGDDVHVLCTRLNYYTVCFLIRHQLEKTLELNSSIYPNPGKVYFHLFDLESGSDAIVDEAVEEFASHLGGGKHLHIVTDEAQFGDSVFGPRYLKLITDLMARDPHLCFWAATFYHDIIPPDMQSEALTVPLRTAPVVLREVQPVIDKYGEQLMVGNYTSGSTKSPADGPSILRIRHEGGDHCEDDCPVACVQCGVEVGRLLQEKLRVGDTRPACPEVNSPPPLQYRDVFIITRANEMNKTFTVEEGRVVPRDGGFLQGLCSTGVRVDLALFSTASRQAQKEMSTVAIARKNVVTMSAWDTLQGLERKVVVWLPGRASNDGEDFHPKRAADLWREKERDKLKDKLAGFSRCSTQLVLVEVPDDM